jgi:N-acyl-D-aspartate/D-glutamate deacylase
MDLIIRSGCAVSPDGEASVDVHVADRRMVAVSDHSASLSDCREEIDGGGSYIISRGN